jgi:hypothetical protein
MSMKNPDDFIGIRTREMFKQFIKKTRSNCVYVLKMFGNVTFFSASRFLQQNRRRANEGNSNASTYATVLPIFTVGMAVLTYCAGIVREGFGMRFEY